MNSYYVGFEIAWWWCWGIRTCKIIFLGPSPLVEEGTVLLWKVRKHSPNDTVPYCCSLVLHYILIFLKNSVIFYLCTEMYLISLLCCTKVWFIGTFAKLWKLLLASSCLSSCLSVCSFVCPFVCLHGTTRLLLDGFSWNLIFEDFFFENLLSIFMFD